MIAYFAKSLYAANTAPLYRYHVGRGVCKVGALSMDDFQVWCRMVEISRYIRDFLVRENAWDERRPYWKAVTDRMITDCCQNFLLRLPNEEEATAIELLLHSWEGLLSERELTLLVTARAKERLDWAGELERSKEWYLEQLSCKDARIAELESWTKEQDRAKEWFLGQIEWKDQHIRELEEENAALRQKALA